jgi:hypothetical protein
MRKPHDKTPELLGAVKVVRAIKDVVYKGTAYRGRKKERFDGKNGSYDIVETHPGDEFTCDAVWAKQAENAGEVVLLSGGRVTITESMSEFPIYERWQHNASDPVPVYERCELLKPMWFGDGCLLPAGTKCRLDVGQCDRSKLCYEDTELEPELHAFRILRPSPPRAKSDAAELAKRAGVLWQKAYPDSTAVAT